MRRIEITGVIVLTHVKLRRWRDVCSSRSSKKTCSESTMMSAVYNICQERRDSQEAFLDLFVRLLAKLALLSFVVR